MRPTSIKLDRKRQFIYNLKALRELEIALGEPLFSVFSDEKKMSSIDVMCKFIWAGMLQEEELTLDDAIDIIPIQDMAEIMGKCGELLASSMVKGDGKKK